MRKKFILLIMSTALLLFIAIRAQTDFQVSSTDYQAIAISAATDTGGGGSGFATVTDRTPAYATERRAMGADYKMPILKHLQPGFALDRQNHRLNKANPNTFDYIDIVTAGAIVSHTTAPSTSTQPFQLRT